MKSKTIKMVLRRKIGAWLKSIDDESLRELAARDCLVTGGAIASMLLGEDVSDYDVYMKTTGTAARLAEYYIASIKAEADVEEEGDRVRVNIRSGAGAASETGEENFDVDPDEESAERYLSFLNPKPGKDAPPYSPRFLTANAITLRNDLQVVLRFTGSAEEIHENYDFVHATCCYDFSENSLTLPPAALESLLAKDLKYVGSLYPICSLIRLRKFLGRGWRITAGQVFKMCWDVAQLDLDDFDTLQEQLTGVDIAYFMELVETMRADREDGQEIDRTYIMTLVDKLF